MLSPYKGGVTVTWTGAAPNTRVKVQLISELGVANYYDYAYVAGDAGSFTLEPACTTGFLTVVCTYYLQPSSTAESLWSIRPIPVPSPNSVHRD